MTTFNKLPVELRIKVYEALFADLIEELSDNLFGVFSFYDHLYDYTAAHLESHVGKTGLTTVLHTCRQVHDEALEVLCNKAEFVVDLLGDDDSLDEERASVRFSENNRMLAFVRNLKLNVEPERDETTERFVTRIRRLLESINHGANLRSLKIRLAAGKSKSPESFDRILTALADIRTAGNAVVVRLGDIPEELVSTERLDLFLGHINGVSEGRGHSALQPKHWDGDDDESEDGAFCSQFD